MRIHGVLIAATAVACAHVATAGSFVAPSPSSREPSVMQLPVQEGTNSFVAPAAAVTTPSIVVMQEQSSSDMPSIIVIGKPADSTARVVDGEAPSANGEGGAEVIKVVRGGDAGGPYPPPTPSAADPLTQPGVPMLDPNDRGTPAKRNALRKQEERLAREAAAAAQNAQQPATPGQ